MKTNAAEAAVLNLIYRAQNWTSVATATAGSTYFALHTAYPGEGNDQSSNEASYSGPYARVGVTRGTAEFDITGNEVDNTNAITFAENTGSAQEVWYASTGVGASGATEMWHIIPLTPSGGLISPFAVRDTTNDYLVVPSHGLSLDDRVACFAEPGGGLPGAVTEGVVYYVGTLGAADGHTITLSTTASNGAPVNISSVGTGVIYEMKSLNITTGVSPRFAGDSGGGGAVRIREY